METPNIDSLAKHGVKFWQAYAPAPTCAPSRCAIMSGNHPARAQKTHVVGGAPPTPNHKYGWTMMAPWYSGRMPANEKTIARVLQSEWLCNWALRQMAYGHRPPRFSAT